SSYFFPPCILPRPRRSAFVTAPAQSKLPSIVGAPPFLCLRRASLLASAPPRSKSPADLLIPRPWRTPFDTPWPPLDPRHWKPSCGSSLGLTRPRRRHRMVVRSVDSETVAFPVRPRCRHSEPPSMP